MTPSKSLISSAIRKLSVALLVMSVTAVPLVWVIAHCHAENVEEANTRVESGFIAEQAEGKALVLRIGQRSYGLVLANTAGLQRPVSGDPFVVFLKPDRALEVCFNRRDMQCFDVQPDTGEALRERLSRLETIGQLESRQRQAYEANKFTF